MPTAFSLSRLLASSAARALPRRASAQGPMMMPAAFGAPVPVGRLLRDGRLFAFSNGNGLGARGAHTATAAAPRGSTSHTGAGGAKPHTSAKAKEAASTTELVFEEMRGPLEEVRASEHDVSLARAAEYTGELEEAVNAQINVELTISHIYHAMYAYFDRDNVALPGLARYFLKNSGDERKHAEGLMDFQNRRGGRVLLQHVPQPMSDFDDAEKGDALNALELALSLEKLNYQKLMHLDGVATEAGDFNLADFVDTMLEDQTQDVKRAADYVSQLRRVGKGHGTWAWDQQLYEEYE